MAAGLAVPALSREASRPVFSHGVQSGDVDTASGVIWTRTDRPARIMIEVATTDSFSDPRRLAPLDATPSSDMAIKRLVEGLPPDQDIFYRFVAADLYEVNAKSAPIVGHFRTAPSERRAIRFAWSGDTAGQGWGIDAEGMRTYTTIAGHQPDFFIHSGDTVYADGPMTDTVIRDGRVIWQNVDLPEAKRKVAETLDEFRAQWKYNLRDRHLREMSAFVPSFMQWDDHEVVDNWSLSKSLMSDTRYTEKSVRRLQARASQAFHEMTPLRTHPTNPARVYRKISYGPMLDVFFLDLRSYRGPNAATFTPDLTASQRILGAAQMMWLKRALAASTATWKVIACDQPLGLVVWDDWRDQSGADAVADGTDGPAMGREVEIAQLLRFVKTSRIHNTVWLTADVHYTAAHFYNPNTGRFQDFEPFWEFVTGPLHAGTSMQSAMDATFGGEVKFVKASSPEQGFNLPPSAGLQFFGLVDIDPSTEQMTVRLMDRADTELYAVTLDPKGSRF